MFTQESDGERALARILQGVDPQPRWGVWVTPDIRVDALWVDIMLVIEYDGRENHTRERDRARDQARRRRLEELGYTVVVATAEDLHNPEALRARLLGLREGLLARR